MHIKRTCIRQTLQRVLHSMISHSTAVSKLKSSHPFGTCCRSFLCSYPRSKLRPLSSFSLNFSFRPYDMVYVHGVNPMFSYALKIFPMPPLCLIPLFFPFFLQPYYFPQVTCPICHVGPVWLICLCTLPELSAILLCSLVYSGSSTTLMRRRKMAASYSLLDVYKTRRHCGSQGQRRGLSLQPWKIREYYVARRAQASCIQCHAWLSVSGINLTTTRRKMLSGAT